MEFGRVGFQERGKLDNPVINLSWQGREPTTNSTHIWLQCWDLSPGHIGGRQVHHKCTTLALHATLSLCSSCSLSVLLCTQPSTLINISEYAKVSPVSSVTVSGSMPLHSLLTSRLSEIYSDARMALLGHLRIYRFSVEVTL